MNNKIKDKYLDEFTGELQELSKKMRNKGKQSQKINKEL